MTTSDSSDMVHAGILIVACDARVSQRLRQLLQTESHQTNFDVRIAADLAAVQRAASEWLPDAVLLDPRLPDLEDLQAVAAIRKILPDAALLVLVPAAHHESNLRVLAFEDDAVLTLGDDLADTILPSLQQALATRQARRCCQELGEHVETLRDQLARNQTALADEVQQRTQLEDLFQSNRSDYFAILDSAPAMIWYIDKDGTILRANKRAAESAGIPVSGLVGQDYYKLFAPHHHVTPAENQAIMQSGRPSCGTVTQTQTADGPQWLRIDRIPWTDQAGRVTGITIFATDITEARQSEDQLKAAKDHIERVNAQLRAAARQAQACADQAIAANRVKSRFLANVTHELRTPMNAILGYGDLLADEQLTREQTKYLNIIQKSAQNLLALIDDVLDFSKIEAEKLDVRIIPCDPRQLLADVHDLMKRTADRKGLALTLAAADLPPMINTDPDRLRQCLTNLVGNALKFTDAGSVTIAAALSNTGDNHLLRIDVRDTGIGIAPEKQQHIFESFAQADTTVSAARGGTGLGLTITRRLMELLGGTVELASEPGKGSTFTLVLPVNSTTSAKPAQSQVRCSPDAETCPQFDGNILLIENEPSDRLLVHLMLSRAGLRIDEVCDACSAVQQLRRNAYDLILIDTALPAPGAEHVLHQIKADRHTPPIVALSTKAPDAECLLPGCSDRLIKPFIRKDLYEILAKHLQAPVPSH